MWLLSFIPDFIFHIIAIVGILLTIGAIAFGQIPFIGTYNIPINIIGVVLIIFGFYMEGAISNEESWQAKVKEMELKVAAAEVKSSKENIKIVEKVVKKTEYITRRGQDIIQYVDKEVVKYDTKFAPSGQCELPKEFIKAINNAAEIPK
jgi:hypothetical protein